MLIIIWNISLAVSFRRGYLNRDISSRILCASFFAYSLRLNNHQILTAKNTQSFSQRIAKSIRM